MLALLLLLFATSNAEAIVVPLFQMRFAPPRLYFYYFVAYATAGVYWLVALLAIDGLTLLWNARFGVQGFIGNFSFWYSFFLAITPLVVGVIALMLVEHVIEKWERASDLPQGRI